MLVQQKTLLTGNNIYRKGTMPVRIRRRYILDFTTLSKARTTVAAYFSLGYIKRTYVVQGANVRLSCDLYAQLAMDLLPRKIVKRYGVDHLYLVRKRSLR